MVHADKDLNLGILGMSEGNGHPYSWAAICNGYDPVALAACGFPAIPAYLAERKFPEDQLPGVRVTHVWTQSGELSRHIASASRIERVCEKPEDMIGQVDGILLARDDAENHLRFASPFLRAGLPVYVDKPFALSSRNATLLWNEAANPEQIFTCSALYFSSEILPAEELSKIGKIRSVHAMTPKTWNTYGAHIVDPVLRVLGDLGAPVVIGVFSRNGANHLIVEFKNGPVVHFEATGRANSSIQFHFTGEHGELTTVFRDSFTAFRSALAAFRDQIQLERQIIPRLHVERVVSLLEAGCG